MGDDLAGEVDEHLLAGHVVLAEHEVQPACVLPVVLGKPGVLEALGVLLLVLHVEQLERHPLAPQLEVNSLLVRPRSLLDWIGLGDEQPSLQLRIVHLGRQWPGQTGGLGTL